jgi:hypothetical protein
MLLLRNRLEEGDSFATLAQREMNTLTGAIEHSILPLQDAIRVSDFPRAPGRTPAWQASITWDEEGEVFSQIANRDITPARTCFDKCNLLSLASKKCLKYTNLYSLYNALSFCRMDGS